MNGTELREKARSAFEARRQGAATYERPERLLAEIPSGAGITLKVYWELTRAGHDELRLQGFEVGPDGRGDIPLSKFGLRLRPAQLPLVAAAIADALDQLEVTDYGLRVKAAPPCGGGSLAPAAAPTSAFPSGRRDR